MTTRFEGTADYIATDDLRIAVNAAVHCSMRRTKWTSSAKI